jgi:SWIM zinc finger
VNPTSPAQLALGLHERERRGLRIAATCKLTKKGGIWLVPSQSGRGRYTVSPDPESPHCSCPDHEMRGLKCKHLFAVEFAIKRQDHRDGSITVTKTVTVTETVKKPTYPQQWPAYNTAQTHEKDKFQVLLSDLCQGLEELPPAKGIHASPSRMPCLPPALRSTVRCQPVDSSVICGMPRRRAISTRFRTSTRS